MGASFGAVCRKHKLDWKCKSTQREETNSSGLLRLGSPRIELRNASSFRVSYWVIHEDRWALCNRTSVVTKHMENVMGIIDTSGTTSLASSKRRELFKEYNPENYILVKDSRGGPWNGSGNVVHVTTIEFPTDAKNLRVCGFFKLNSVWVRFKDRVYSIGRSNKIFTLTALNQTLKEYIEEPQIRKRAKCLRVGGNTDAWSTHPSRDGDDRRQTIAPVAG